MARSNKIVIADIAALSAALGDPELELAEGLTNVKLVEIEIGLKTRKAEADAAAKAEADAAAKAEADGRSG